MKQRFCLSLAAFVFGIPLSQGATLLQRSGSANAQCCQFNALAIGWHQDTTWTDVSVEIDVNNNGSSPQPNTAVALLTTSLGPGTTEPQHEVDDAVIAVTGPGQQTVTPFTGLTLGPGTYYLVYFSVSNAFADYVLMAWDTNVANAPVLGPGVTLQSFVVEDVNAPYRPASTWTAVNGSVFLVNITGTPMPMSAPVPEPSSYFLTLGAACLLAAVRSLRLRKL